MKSIQKRSLFNRKVWNWLNDLLIVYLHCFLLYFPFSTISGQFVDRTSESGFIHTHRSGSLLGGGAAILDVDSDGWSDIVVTGGIDQDVIFINNRDGTFVRNTDHLAHNSSKDYITSGVVFGDFDNDGCTDLFITTFSKNKNNLILRNDCSGRYIEMSQVAGITEAGQSIGAAVFDFDMDGLLDIYVINYIDETRFIRNESGEVIGYDHACQANFLYHNEGNFKFSERSGHYLAQGNGCSLAVATFMMDNVPAVYIANDFGEWIQPNELFVFDTKEGMFNEISHEKGLDIALYGMGISYGDYDNDLDEDIYVTNLGKNYLMQNRGSFVDVASEKSIDNTWTARNKHTTGWGTLFLDYDNDADLDLFVANGYIPSAPFLMADEQDESMIFEQVGDQFIPRELGMDSLTSGKNRGLVYGDFDNDGDMDIVVVSVDLGTGDTENIESSLFLENNNETGNFLQVRLEGVTSNRDGFGTRVYVHGEGKTFLRELFSGGTHASQSSSELHFGLGELNYIDSIVLIWPNGNRQVHDHIPVSQRILIVEDETEIGIIGCMSLDSESYNPMATVPISCMEFTTRNQAEKREIPSIIVYPNIAYDKLNLVSSVIHRKASFYIYNISGHLFDLGELNLNDFGTESIQIDNLPGGLYILHIKVSSIPQSISLPFIKAFR